MEPKIGNPELLKLAVKTIESDLSRWDQQRFCSWDRFHEDIETEYRRGRRALRMVDIEACGTTFCLAGEVSLLAGYVPAKDGTFRDSQGQNVGSGYDAARDALGLDDDQAAALFYKTAMPIDSRTHAPLNSETPGAWKYYKGEITRVTGVEFD
jgi:hypothetical protein